MTIEKRIADLLNGNAFAASGGSRLPALHQPHQPRETRPCDRCHLLTDTRSLTPIPGEMLICPVCYDLAGADMSEYDRQAYDRLMAAVFHESPSEARRRANWDRWAHRLTLLAFGGIGFLVLLLIYKNVTGGER